ncbi:ProQ/FINO family protein [Aidingimonas lacisalsi]|uniref:ProQ/FINO family protein n=1 Tax=Aidingimonas lacisalsi TaxID=2604086 RepID=UPI001F2D640D|nr:ProQ/FINO family protein [Aidingimonas lacisalsi]
MLEQRVNALFEALEQQLERHRHEWLAVQERLAELAARNRELQASQSELQTQLDAAKAAPESAPKHRSQGLAALMARRGHPRVATNDTSDDTPVASASDEAPEREPAGAEQDSETRAEQAPSHADDTDDAQSRLPIGEAPGPQALLDQWYQRYTETFFKGHTRPLKVGIHKDLMAREPWPEKLVRRALACYVHLPRYLKAVRTGAERVDLDGNNAGQVTEGEAKYARRQLEELRAQDRSRQARQQQRQQQQDRADRLERKIGELLAKHER